MSGRKHSDETKQIISEASFFVFLSKGENNPRYNKPKPEESGNPSQAIEVTDITNNQTTTYDSISEAARALNLPNFQAIANYIKNNQQKPYKGRYTFKKINGLVSQKFQYFIQLINPKIINIFFFHNFFLL